MSFILFLFFLTVHSKFHIIIKLHTVRNEFVPLSSLPHPLLLHNHPILFPRHPQHIQDIQGEAKVLLQRLFFFFFFFFF